MFAPMYVESSATQGAGPKQCKVARGQREAVTPARRAPHPSIHLRQAFPARGVVFAGTAGAGTTGQRR